MEIKMYTPEFFAAVKYTAISIGAVILGILPKFFYEITWDGFIAALQPFSYFVTTIAGFMAIRHWYLATKKLNDKNRKP